jgi:hypothetical protein
MEECATAAKIEAGKKNPEIAGVRFGPFLVNGKLTCTL